MADKIKRQSDRFVDGKKGTLQVLLKPQRANGTKCLVLVRHCKVGEKPQTGMTSEFDDLASAQARFQEIVKEALLAKWQPVDKLRGVPRSTFDTMPPAAEGFPRAVKKR